MGTTLERYLGFGKKRQYGWGKAKIARGTVKKEGEKGVG